MTRQIPFTPPTALTNLPLLITGVAGVAGLNALHWFRQKYGNRVMGQRPSRNWPLRGPGIIGLDLEDVAATRKLISDQGIRSILNCGGSCALKSCELDERMARRVNVESVRCLLDAVEGMPVRLIHLSIDLVYSGKIGRAHV